MVGITDINGKILKHYAQDFVNHKRYVLVSLQNGDDTDSCSVIDIDDLDSNIRSELIALVNSTECQSVKEIYPVLNRKFFLDYPSATMLKVLKAMKKMLVVKSDQVAIQVPGEQTITPKDLLKAINEYESKKSIAKKQVFDLNDVEEMSKEPVKNEEIESIKNDIKSLNEQVNSLVSSLTSLTEALANKDVKKKK